MLSKYNFLQLKIMHYFISFFSITILKSILPCHYNKSTIQSYDLVDPWPHAEFIISPRIYNYSQAAFLNTRVFHFNQLQLLLPVLIRNKWP